ncbi:MAG: flagellar filament capping protein FliD [Calditrichae bacterium]|nr:flagellar filament capping protein FliD [Calditrichia bacterium]
MDVSSLFSGQGSIQYLVDQFMSFEQGPKDRLTSRRSSLNDKIKILSDLDSKLSALQAKTERMTDEFTNYFAAKKAGVSNSEVLKATASSDAMLGNHVLTVERLAAFDTRVSNQFVSTDSDFSSYTTDHTFQIEVSHKNEDDELSRVTIDVTIAASEFEGDNQTVFQAIANAVNGAMDQAVADELINNEERVRASVLNEESNTSRLSLRSDHSGYTYRMDFGSSSLLDDLNVNNAALTDGATGGYMHDVGTSESTSELNSKFTLNGLTFYRDSSTVTDALDGLTLQFLNTFTSQETVSVSTNTESVRKEIDDFISAYNDSINFLREKTQYNSSTKERGPLSEDYTIRNIAMGLRNISQSEVTDVTYSNYNLLYDIGIEADQQGRLSVKDSEKLTKAIETNPEFVSDLFNGSDGIATRINDYIEDFVKVGGSISSSKENLNSEIQSINDRLKVVESLLGQKEKQLFNDFSRLQETMYTLQSQQSFFSMFTGLYSG